MHRHRAIPGQTYERCFRGPVGRDENPAAHGNITRYEECNCGARRVTNINGSHWETTGWYREDGEDA